MFFVSFLFGSDLLPTFSFGLLNCVLFGSSPFDDSSWRLHEILAPNNITIIYYRLFGFPSKQKPKKLTNQLNHESSPSNDSFGYFLFLVLSLPQKGVNLCIFDRTKGPDGTNQTMAMSSERCGTGYNTF